MSWAAHSSASEGYIIGVLFIHINWGLKNESFIQSLNVPAWEVRVYEVHESRDEKRATTIWIETSSVWILSLEANS